MERGNGVSRRKKKKKGDEKRGVRKKGKVNQPKPT